MQRLGAYHERSVQSVRHPDKLFNGKEDNCEIAHFSPRRLISDDLVSAMSAVPPLVSCGRLASGLQFRRPGCKDSNFIPTVMNVTLLRLRARGGNALTTQNSLMIHYQWHYCSAMIAQMKSNHCFDVVMGCGGAAAGLLMNHQ